jgi:hypothetical protein
MSKLHASDNLAIIQMENSRNVERALDREREILREREIKALREFSTQLPISRNSGPLQQGNKTRSEILIGTNSQVNIQLEQLDGFGRRLTPPILSNPLRNITIPPLDKQVPF